MILNACDEVAVSPNDVILVKEFLEKAHAKNGMLMKNEARAKL